MRTLKASLLLVALALSACATTPGRIEEIDTSQARALYDEGDFLGAAVEYERLAGANRRTRDALLLAAAEALREEGDHERVAGVAQRIRRDRLAPAQQVRL